MKMNVRALWLIVIFLLPGYLVKSQGLELNKVITDSTLNEQVLFGYCDRKGLEGEIFGTVFQEYYKIYEPDKTILDKIKPRLDSVSITIVMGTWCSDSEEQVPKFMKVLDKVRFNDKNLTIICVNKAKEAGDIDLKEYYIQRVPTFIIFKKDNELGRIIETPMINLEKDLLMILEG
jgi:thiol-disulfide isomerase/thioredoxin